MQICLKQTSSLHCPPVQLCVFRPPFGLGLLLLLLLVQLVQLVLLVLLVLLMLVLVLLVLVLLVLLLWQQRWLLLLLRLPPPPPPPPLGPSGRRLLLLLVCCCGIRGRASRLPCLALLLHAFTHAHPSTHGQQRSSYWTGTKT